MVLALNFPPIRCTVVRWHRRRVNPFCMNLNFILVIVVLEHGPHRMVSVTFAVEGVWVFGLSLLSEWVSLSYLRTSWVFSCISPRVHQSLCRQAADDKVRDMRTPDSGFRWVSYGVKFKRSIWILYSRECKSWDVDRKLLTTKLFLHVLFIYMEGIHYCGRRVPLQWNPDTMISQS